MPRGRNKKKQKNGLSRTTWSSWSSWAKEVLSRDLRSSRLWQVSTPATRPPAPVTAIIRYCRYHFLLQYTVQYAHCTKSFERQLNYYKILLQFIKDKIYCNKANMSKYWIFAKTEVFFRFLWWWNKMKHTKLSLRYYSFHYLFSIITTKKKEKNLPRFDTGFSGLFSNLCSSYLEQRKHVYHKHHNMHTTLLENMFTINITTCIPHC